MYTYRHAPKKLCTFKFDSPVPHSTPAQLPLSDLSTWVLYRHRNVDRGPESKEL